MTSLDSHRGVERARRSKPKDGFVRRDAPERFTFRIAQLIRFPENFRTGVPLSSRVRACYELSSDSDTNAGPAKI